MSLFVAPPHRDVSRLPELPAGTTLHDAAQAYVARALRTPPTTVLGRAAAAVLAREGAPAWSRLRGAAVLLDAASAPNGVRTVLDDLRLPSGGTESPEEIALAAQAPLPFAPELDAVPNGPATTWVETDQAVLGALVLAARAKPVALCGAFAQAHRATFEAWAPFQGVALAPRPWVRVGAIGPVAPPSSLYYREKDEPLPPGRFCGYLSGEEPFGPVLDASVVVVPLAALAPDAALLVDGTRVGTPRLLEACARWVAAGVSVGLELHVGAPGVADWSQAAKVCSDLPQGVWVLGVRPFHLPRHFAAEAWGGVGLAREPALPGHGFARSTRFQAPGTLSPEAQVQAMGALATELSARHALAPARVALAIAHGPPVKEMGSGALRVASDCAVVPDGAATMACQLRTGVQLKLDARLGLDLAERPQALPDAERLSMVPAAQREKVRAALLAKGVLEEVSP